MLKPFIEKLREILDEAYPVGKRRKWKSGWRVKRKDGKWVPIPPPSAPRRTAPPAPPAEEPETKVAPPVRRPIEGEPAVKARPGQFKPARVPRKRTPEEVQVARREILSDLDKMRSEGKLPGDLTSEQHLDIATEFLGHHERGFRSVMGRLRETVGAMEVQGRVKDVNSAMGKVVRKPAARAEPFDKRENYSRVDEQADGTGMRVMCDTLDEVKETVKKIRAKFKVVYEDDYITRPKGSYRSHHLLIEDEDGLVKEIQVRTRRQHDWAEWCHDAYKPQTPEQEAAVKEAEETIRAYGEMMSEYYLALDTGRHERPEIPGCPMVVKKHFGCLPDTAPEVAP